MKRALAILLGLCTAGALQSRAQSPPAYEVASIRPNQSGARVSIRSYPGGRLVATNATLKALIVFAYNVNDYRISGGPGWINSTGYDITASPDRAIDPGPDNIEIFRHMLQGLLADRFKLKVHRDTKELPVYGLLPSREGPKIHEVAQATNPADMRVRGGRGEIIGQKITPTLLASVLSDVLGRPVVDKTNLTGYYDLTLQWTPEESEANGDTLPPAGRTGPSLFTAIQEQLGLKLEAQRGPVEVIVVDSAEKASEN